MRRMVDTNIWEDAKVEELPMTAKLLWVYVLTSPRGNLAGCFELTMRRVSIDTGLTAEQAREAMRELCGAGLASYSDETCEVLVHNWFKHNWSNSPKLLKPLAETICAVKERAFADYLVAAYESRAGKEFPYAIDTVQNATDTVSIPLKPQVEYSVDTLSIEHEYSPISISITNPKEDPKGVGGAGEGEPDSEAIAEIVSHLNAAVGKSYKPTTPKTRSLIRARMREGFTVDDFKTVIDKKAKAWLGTEFAQYLRPKTLFGTNFEGYLNEIQVKPKPKTYEEVGRENFSEYRR